MIKEIFRGAKGLAASAGALTVGIILTLTLVWIYKEVITPKDLSQIEGVWLTHDGDEQLYGKLELRIIHDSAYFGNRVFADGRPDSLGRAGTIMHITKDSLVLSNESSRNFQAWGLGSLDKDHLVLIGDSYSYDFTKQDDAK